MFDVTRERRKPWKLATPYRAGSIVGYTSEKGHITATVQGKLSMLGPLRKRKIRRDAGTFCAEIGTQGDATFYPYMQIVVQCLIDAGMSEIDFAAIANNDGTKCAYMACLCAEQLLAAKNLWGEQVGEIFEKEVYSIFRRIKDDQLRKHFEAVPSLLARFRGDPINSRIHMLFYILEINNLYESKAARNIGNNVVLQLIVRSSSETMPFGIVKKISLS